MPSSGSEYIRLTSGSEYIAFGCFVSDSNLKIIQSNKDIERLVLMK